MENISNKLKIAMIITILIPILMLLLFLIGLSKVEAETQVLSSANLLCRNYYGSNNASCGTGNSHNNVTWWNPGTNSTSIRWNSNTALYYPEINLVVFNIVLHMGNSSSEWPVNNVSFQDYSCFFTRTNLNDMTSNSELASRIGISAYCPVNGNINISSGGNVASITLDNTGGTSVEKVSISNINLTKNSELLSIINTLGNINTFLSPLHQDLTYILQSANNSAYWNEVNSGKLQNIFDIISNQTSTIVQAQNNTTTAINDMANEDIDAQTKQPVDNTNVNDYNTKEANLMNTATQTNLNGVNIGIDTTASGNIWQLITRILNTNAKVFGLVISILSIGIIKLMLAR